jgi:hypothetical protein
MSEHIATGVSYEVQWFNSWRCVWQLVDSFHSDSIPDDQYDAVRMRDKLSTDSSMYRVVEVNRRVIY